MKMASCEACGHVTKEPSQIQLDVATTKHRLECPNYSMCRVCTELGVGRLRILDKGKPAVFVCDRCAKEHPRQGNYAFDHGREPSRVNVGQRGKKK